VRQFRASCLILHSYLSEMIMVIGVIGAHPVLALQLKNPEEKIVSCCYLTSRSRFVDRLLNNRIHETGRFVFTLTKSVSNIHNVLVSILFPCFFGGNGGLDSGILQTSQSLKM